MNKSFPADKKDNLSEFKRRIECWSSDACKAAVRVLGRDISSLGGNSHDVGVRRISSTIDLDGEQNTTMLSRRLVARVLQPSKLWRASSTKAHPSASVPAEASQAGAAPQAPNYTATWSTNQRPRPAARSGPRFEQTAMELQPNPLSAMELIANEPVRIVHGRKAVCDGGGGPLGHPKIFINLDKPGSHPCGWVI
ncbi:hypothetical protein ID866_2518 [Astraeus odoratus]|nr:hypothetical protein ID866_2518 [Astraeus odoratus]